MPDRPEPDIKYVIRHNIHGKHSGYHQHMDYYDQHRPGVATSSTDVRITACRKYDTQQEAAVVVAQLVDVYAGDIDHHEFMIEPRDVGPKVYLVDINVPGVDPAYGFTIAKGTQVNVPLSDNAQWLDPLRELCLPYWLQSDVANTFTSYEWNKSTFRIVYPADTPWYMK